jgi:hypothetical protein
MSWILVLYVYAGAFAKGDSVTLQAIPGFKTQVDCVAAGTAAAPLVANSAKELRYICLRQP